MKPRGLRLVLLLVPALLAFGGFQDSPAEKGVNYLKSKQAADGSWSSGGKQIIDTVEALDTLAIAPGTSAQVVKAGTFVAGKTTKGTDGRARRLLGLADTTLDLVNAKTDLLAEQNSDGSWGASRGHGGVALDTALAVRALSKARSLDVAAIAKASLFLDATRTTSGGWGMQEEEAADLYVTANVIAALGEFALATGLSTPDLMDNLVKGTAFILSQQNGDGSFGAQDKVATTSWCMMALLRTSQPTALAGAGTFLTNAQLGDGSWEDSVHLTALATRAILERDSPPAAPADLVVTSISFDPGSPGAGQTTFVTVTVKNQGTRTAKTVDVSVTSDGGVLGPVFSIASIPPGSSAQITFTSTFAAGSHTILATVDPANRVIESNDGNNSGSATLTVASGALPDLTVTGIVATPASPLAGQSFTLTTSVQNGGSVAVKNVAVSFFDGDPSAGGTKVGNDVILPLVSAGSTSTATVSISLKSGSHTIFAVADRAKLIAETNETNNQASAALTVLPANTALPDLVSTLSVSNSSPGAGESITLTAQVVNTSTSYLNPGVVVRFFDGPTQIGDQFALPSLPTGSPATITVSASFAPGVHRLTVVADATNVLAELSESNNVAERFVTVAAGDLADLVITLVDVSKTSLDSGEPVTVSAKVKNVGTKAAGSFVVRFSDETPGGGNKIGDFGVSSLAPGVEILTQLAWLPPLGSHHVFAEADATHRVAETNEGNNLSAGPMISVSTTVFVDPAVFTEEGKEHFIAVPPVFETAFLILTAEKSTAFTVTGGATASGTVAPGTPVILTLPDTAKVTSIPPNVDVKGIKVTATEPIRAFLVLGFPDGAGGLSDTREATLVLPKPTLSSDYRVASFGGANFTIGEAGLLVVGTEANTSVSVQIAGTTPQTFNFTLQSGEVFRFPATFDITGSRVTSSKPVAVVSYTTASFTNQPSLFGTVHPNPVLEEMIPSDFFGTRHFIGTQINSAVYYLARVVAHEDGTQVTAKRNGLTSQTFTLSAGEFKDLDAGGGLEIVSTKPVYVVRYWNWGDAALMSSILPSAAYSQKYRFHVLSANSFHASYGTIVAPLAGTEIRVNGMVTPLSNSPEILEGDVRWANEVFRSDFELGSMGATEIVVEATRPVQVNVYGGLFLGRHAYLAGYRFQKKEDLAVSSITPGVAEPFTGSATSVAVRVTNLSFADAVDVRVQLFDGEILVGEATISSIPREADATAMIPWTPQIPGDRPLVAVLDPANTVLEAREDNNSLTRTTNVQASVQLTGSLGLSGNAFLGNQDIAIATSIANLSTSVLQGNFKDAQLVVEIQDANGNVVMTLPSVSMTELFAVPDGLGGWHFFVEATITPSATRTNSAILSANVNLSQLVEALGLKGSFDGNSLRVFEIVGEAFAERQAVFLPAADFNARINAKGQVEWIVPGPLTAGVQRKFRIYFDTLENGAKAAVERILEPTYTNDQFDAVFAFPPPQIDTSLVLSDRKGGLSSQSVPNDPYFFFNGKFIQASALSDFGGDAFHDIARHSGNAERPLQRLVYLLRTNGGNAFASERPLALSLPLVASLVQLKVSNLGGDANDDIVAMTSHAMRPKTGNVGFEEVTLIQVFHGKGDGRLTLRQEFVALIEPPAGGLNFDIADVNGDGKMDLVLSQELFVANQVKIHVFLGMGDGVFTTTPVTDDLGTFTGHNKFVAGDFDSDGKADLVFPPSGGSATGTFVKGNGNGTFQTPQPFTNAPSGDFPPLSSFGNTQVYSLDYNRDGKLDLTYSTGEFSVAVVFGDGMGKFTSSVKVDLSHLTGTFSGLKLTQASASAATSAKKTGAFLKDFTFNTNGLLAGNYKVVVKVTTASGQLLFTTSDDFEILSLVPGTTPASITASRVITNKSTYFSNETATITSTVLNLSGNTALTDLTLKLKVTSPSASTVFTDEKTVATVQPATSFSFDSKMSTGSLAPGTYTAKLEVVKGGQVISQDDATFSIAATQKFAGTLALSPSQVSPGGSFTINFTLQNLGNVDLINGTAEFRIVNPSSQLTLATFTKTVSVAAGQTLTDSTSGSAAGLTPGTYLIVYRVFSGPQSFGIAQTLLKVAASDCPFLAFAVFGDQLVKFGGTASTNDVANQQKGHVFSNVKVEVGGKSIVRGDAKSGGTVTKTSNATVTGTITQNATQIPLPSIDPLVDFIALNNSNASIGLTEKGKNPLQGTEFALAANDSITLGPGFYFFSKFQVNGTLKVTGLVVIALAGDTGLQNNAVLNPTENASKLLLVSKTTLAIKFAGKVKFTGAVYAPKAPVSATADAEIRGTLVGKTLAVEGQAKIIHDPTVNAHCTMIQP